MRDVDPKRGPGRDDGGESAEPKGVVGRLVGLLSGRGEPGRKRRRALREHARRVQRSRPRLYNYRASTAEPAMGALFHTFYKTLGPARILLRNASASAVLRSIAVERFLSDGQREVLADLSDQALTARAQSTDTKDLLEHVRGRLKALAGGFDRRSVERARRAYRAVLVLVDLVTYDYWSILRRFDSRYPETDFTYSPRFLPLDAAYVAEPLKDFLDVLAPVEGDMDWAQALDIIREFRGMELIGAEAWKGLARTIAEIKRSGLLVAIVRLIDGDPSYTPEARSPQVRPVESYLGAVRKQVEASVRRAVDARRQQGIEALTRTVFGERELPRLSGYTLAANERLARKSLPPFAFCLALGYVKAYLIELHKTTIKQTVDSLLIRGAWRDPALSRSVSDTYQETLSVLADILEFDRSLGDNQALGVRLRTAVARAERGKEQTSDPAKKLIAQIDAVARRQITRVVQGCVAAGQLFRSLIEDSGRPNPEILANWAELRGPPPGSGKGENLRADVAASLRTLDAFLQLVRLSTARSPQTAPAEGTSEEASDLPPDPTSPVARGP
jgi:hypothetical protein